MPKERIEYQALDIALPERTSLHDVVSEVIDRGRQGWEPDRVRQALVDLGLSAGDADLAWDRTHGGIVRAGSGARDNRPDRHHDPIAWTAYELAVADRSIIRDLHPPDHPPRPWWHWW